VVIFGRTPHQALFQARPAACVGTFHGGPAYTFSKPENPAELIDDLVLLHTKLVDLGVVYRNGKVYLADLEETDV
jgi:hypothetical protein